MTKQASIKRWNPLLGEWVIFAPVTDVRPWSGAVVKKSLDRGPKFDSGCYLCPGVVRSTGTPNPLYTGAFVFNNDFPSLSMSENSPERLAEMGGGEMATGVCRVVCFSPVHNITLAEMEKSEIEKVLEAFAREFQELAAQERIEYVMLFENKGKEIGVSNPHPHGQIYATDFVPKLPATMYKHASEHAAKHGHCLFCDILKEELAEGSGIVYKNAHFAAYVPSFARFKYEVHIVPLRHVPFLSSLTREEMASLADVYQRVLIKYDNLFDMIIPNITIFYNAPTRKDADISVWHFHMQFAPPLRSAEKLKYLAGFETGGGNIINPALPKTSAEELRKASDVHFSKASSQ